ncbi:MAG: hypothetical protein V4548_08985 [Bacteroidota bacterium]
MAIKIKTLLFFLLFSGNLFSQPFVDIVSFNYQSFSSKYKTDPDWKNTTDNFTLSIFLPKELKNGNTLLFRINAENIQSKINGDLNYSSDVSSVAFAFGFQWVSKNKKWKTILMGIPKLASSFDDKMTSEDWQCGGYFLESYIPNKKVKFKAGLYYNKEAFGNFFVPLLGVDWKIANRWNAYGVLPTNYKIEYSLIKEKAYLGLNFKSMTRSFSLSEKQGLDYVRYDEMQFKLTANYFVQKKIVLFGEIGYSLGKNPLQYQYKTDVQSNLNPIYTELKNYPVFNIGIAYRLRTE